MEDVEVLVEEPWEPEDRHRESRRFSVGIVTQSLLRLGMLPEEALRIANKVRDELERCGAKRVRHSELHGVLLSRLEGLPATEARYTDRLRYLDERDGTLAVLVGGTSESGKSTVAARVARRLGIEHMVGTDSLREALRSAIPLGVAPALHESSYTAHKMLTGFVGEDAKIGRLGFLEHARPVATGLPLSLKRMNLEFSEGAIIHADKGYTDYEHEDFLKEVGLELKTQRKKNSKQPMPAWEEFLGKPTRQYIETVFSRLTSFLPKKIHAVTSRGFELKIVCFLLAFSIQCL